eukprot:66003_1
MIQMHLKNRHEQIFVIYWDIYWDIFVIDFVIYGTLKLPNGQEEYMDDDGNVRPIYVELEQRLLNEEECGNTGEEADAPIAKADDEDEYEEEKEPKDGDKAQDEYEDDADETEGVDEDEYEEENEPKEEAQDAIVKDEEMVADDGMHWIEGNDNWERDMPYDELRRWKIVWKTYFGIQKTFPNLEQDMDELWAL